MSRLEKAFFFVLLSLWVYSVAIASSFWSKHITDNPKYPDRLALYDISVNSEKALTVARVFSRTSHNYYFGAFLLDKEGNLLESKIFRPVVGGEEKNVGPHTKGLFLEDGGILFAGKYQFYGGGLPFFVLLKDKTSKTLYLEDPRKQLRLRYSLITPAEKFVPSGDYVYFVAPAYVNEDCGVHGFYIAKVKKDLSRVVWHKFLTLAYEKQTCYGRCTTIFPATCLLHQHSLELRDAVADREGNLILVGKIQIAYFTAQNITPTAGFAWSISPSGETNWFKIYARIGEEDDHPLSFDKAVIYENGEQEVLIVAGQTRAVQVGSNVADTLWLGAIDPQNGRLIDHKIGRYSENPRSFRADIVQGMSLYQGKLYISFLGYIDEDYLRNSLLVIDPQSLTQEKLYKYINVPSKDMIPWYNSGSTVIFISLRENNKPYLYTFDSNGRYCRGQGELYEGEYLSDDFPLISVIDWSDLPVPEGSSTITYSLKIYDTTAGSYKEGSISFANDASLSIYTVCEETNALPIPTKKKIEYVSNIDLSPVKGSSVQLIYRGTVDILVGVLTCDFKKTFWLNPDTCTFSSTFAYAHRRNSLICEAINLPVKNGYIFWLVSPVELGALDFRNGIYELYFYMTGNCQH